MIVARDPEILQQAIKYIKGGAKNPETQRFHHISADLKLASESIRIIAEVTQWNDGNPPDTVWCCAGTAHPTLFIDTPVSIIQDQMESNYFSSAYMAHAALTSWLKPLEDQKGHGGKNIARSSTSPPPPARHLIFTASFVALFSFTGYGSYGPAKAALRTLSDTLSQEMNLYASAYPDAPPICLHTIFPATILTEAYKAENIIKHGVTKKLEEGDEGQTAEVVARKAIQSLEGGQELITTDILTWLVKGSMFGGSLRGGFWMALLQWFLAGLMGIVMVFVRADMDGKVKAWGRQFGVAESKRINN